MPVTRKHRRTDRREAMKIKGLLLLLTGLLIGTSVPASVVDVDEPDVCLMCHSDIENLMTKNHLHSAFEGGQCSDCHNPHASRHAALLNDDPGQLCFDCHEDVEKQTHLAVAHEPAGEGECLSCHDPHAADYSNQLKMSNVELCEQCHSNIDDWMKRANIHLPVADAECMVCHSPHGSENERLLTQKIPGICLDCHDQDAAFNAAHKGYRLENANCVTCHDPHSSSEPNLLMPNQHAPFSGGKCNMCHAPQGSGSDFALVADVKTVCTKCHKDIKNEDTLTYHHNLDDEQSCMNCHNPHASSTGSLLAARQKDLCNRCHFDGEKFAAKKKEDYITHDGMDCSNCHTPHGSNNSRYLDGDGLEVCNTCHADAHKGSHPVGKGIVDPRNNTELTCLSCHKLHGADFDPYLPLDPQMDLCIQCHRR